MLERNSSKRLKGNVRMDDAYIGGARSGSTATALARMCRTRMSRNCHFHDPSRAAASAPRGRFDGCRLVRRPSPCRASKSFAGANMKVLILWADWAGYMDACANQLQQLLSCELDIVCFERRGEKNNPFSESEFFAYPCNPYKL